METKLERIASKSANIKRPEFTSLYHLINKEMLLQCHRERDGSKAVGIDEITKREYSENLESNIENLVDRLKRKAYNPQPSLRVYRSRNFSMEQTELLFFTTDNTANTRAQNSIGGIT